MELHEFVAETIRQITRGVKLAQNELANEWVRINPRPPDNAVAVGPLLYTATNGAGVFPLTFDVAVSAEDRTGDRGGGIKVLGVEINAKDGSTASRSTISRVTFTVPVAYPLKDIGGDE